MSNKKINGQETDMLMEMTVRVVSAHVSNNKVAIKELQALLRDTHATLSGLHGEESGGVVPSAVSVEIAEPAVSIEDSIQDDYIICLEDGKELQMLKRYLRSRYNMSPEEYRRKWGLPQDYPMVAPGYSRKRRKLAKAIGLGRNHRG